MKYSDDLVGKHVFEVSGCGVAPFTWVSYWQMPSPTIMEGFGGPEKYNRMMASAPCSVGSCKHCGMPLIHHYIIKDINGKLFAVGCECVNKTGDAGLIIAVEKAKKAIAKAERAEKKAAKVMSAKAIRQAQIQARIDIFRSMNPGVVEFLEVEVAKENCQPIWESFHHQLTTWGNLSENQVKCITEAIKKASEPVFESNWVGTIGKRQTFTNVKVEAIITVPCQSFHYNDRASIDIYILKDASGNVMIYRSKTYQDVKKGDLVEVAASVKEHTEYKGVKQTIIQRPKFAKVS